MPLGQGSPLLFVRGRTALARPRGRVNWTTGPAWGLIEVRPVEALARRETAFWTLFSAAPTKRPMHGKRPKPGTGIGWPIARLAGLVFVLVLGAVAAIAAEPAVAPIDFARDVRPIFAKHCLACHGEKEEEGGLRLDLRARAMEGGVSGASLVKDRAAESLLYQYVTGRNEDNILMPPQGKGERLSEVECELVRRWIDEGAAWPDDVAGSAQAPAKRSEHWAFQSVVRPAVPAVAGAWPRTAIDAFVLQKLNQQALRPAPPAGRTELVRRVTFDLTGLAPTPEEVAAFVADDAPGAYEALIDRLLASPRYGERWGRHWLDLARYADSNGFEFDSDRPAAFHYRDYVIRSFNDDLPYDRFICEQLAGDELAPEQLETLTATGFCRAGPTNENQVNEKNRLDEMDDIISTTGAVFLGLTIGCARCHNHKFEPFSQRDYYQLLAVFNSCEKREVNGRSCVQDTGCEPKATHLMLRGDHRSPGEEVSPGVPEVLAWLPARFEPAAPESKTTGRRTALARWIAAADNPLTARVIVNRVWQYHFGTGLVATSSNFGESGAEPTHPELLDWLASELVAGGWRLKPLHKLILQSATYTQATSHDPAGFQADPANRWLWRFPKRRLEAEVIRDRILQASGNLNPAMYGPGIHPRIDPAIIATGSTAKWPLVESEGPEHWRRSVYIFIKRSVLMPMLEVFDAPTATETCDRRLTTTVATQSLQMLNDPFINRQAAEMARRVLGEVAEDDLAAQAKRVYDLALSRSPTESQLHAATEFLKSQQDMHRRQFTEPAAAIDANQREALIRARALADLCHVMFNASEFIYGS